MDPISYIMYGHEGETILSTLLGKGSINMVWIIQKWKKNLRQPEAIPFYLVENLQKSFFFVAINNWHFIFTHPPLGNIPYFLPPPKLGIPLNLGRYPRN